MPDSYEVLPVEDENSWDEFVYRAIGGTVFSTRAWLDCAQHVTGCRYRCFGVYKNGRLFAGVSGAESRRTGLKQLATPELTPHGGILFAPIASKGWAKIESERGHATEMLALHLTELYDHVQLTLTPPIHDIRQFTWAGWQSRVRYTYQLRLDDLEALWERAERRTRTVIRKAEKAGFNVHQTEDFDLFRRQYELIYARQNSKPPIPAGRVQAFVTTAVEAGLAHALAVVSSEGEQACVVVFVEGSKVAYAWVTGADPAFNATGATSLLYWRYFAQARRHIFDFVGANMPGIAKFKRGFGGNLVPYYVIDGYRNRITRAAVAVRGAAHRVVR